MGGDQFEVLGIVRPEVAGEATSLLLANGIQGEVRMRVEPRTPVSRKAQDPPPLAG
jgi:hypothetical protein